MCDPKKDLENILKVGVIGLGRMGMLHLMNCLQIDDVKVVAVAERLKKLLREAQSAGVNRFYKDYHDLLGHSSDMDAVAISLPNFLHFESIQLALEAGLNVFVENPLANAVEECRARLVERSGGKFGGHSVRFIE
jgi:myo-inositol 2-dehydrogenase/D-chiro-inositol 1-dehydrogenase